MKYISGLDPEGLLDDGNYPAEITSARPRESKTGSEMIEIVLDVGGNGNSVKVIDYLVFNGKPFNSARIDQLRIAIGEIILKGEEIDVEPGDLLHKTCMVSVITEEWNGRKRNKIGSYLEPEDSIPGLGLELETKKKAKV